MSIARATTASTPSLAELPAISPPPSPPPKSIAIPELSALPSPRHPRSLLPRLIIPPYHPPSTSEEDSSSPPSPPTSPFHFPSATSSSPVSPLLLQKALPPSPLLLQKALPPSPHILPPPPTLLLPHAHVHISLADPVTVAAIANPGHHRHLDRSPYPRSLSRASRLIFHDRKVETETDMRVPRSKFSRQGAFPVAAGKQEQGQEQQQQQAKLVSVRSKFTERVSEEGAGDGGGGGGSEAVEVSSSEVSRTQGGHYQKEEFKRYDPEGGPKLLTRRWGREGGTRRTRIVFMTVGVVLMGAVVVVGFLCANAL